MSADTAPAPSGSDWEHQLRRAVGAGGVRAVYQPVVDLARGVVAGYEALARFEDGQSPEAWFAAARAHGVAADLEAAALRSAFAHRATLPANCFLAVNVSPDQLASRAVQRVLADEGDLSGVVVELTEQAAVDSYDQLQATLAAVRAAGALIAVDDAGTGYAGLRHLLDLRPSIVKLDRHFIHDVDRDRAKQVLVEMVGAFADRTDCWVLAEGVERIEELGTVADLGVPLAQGYLLGRPAPPWSAASAGLAAWVSARRRPSVAAATVGDLLVDGPACRDAMEAAAVLAADDGLDAVVVLDDHGRPAWLARPDAVALGILDEALRVHVSTPVAQTLRRALVRPAPRRFTPVVVTDETGAYLGVVPVEHLVDQLLTLAAPGA